MARGTDIFGLSNSWIESVNGSGHTLYDGRLSQAMLEATRYSEPFAPSEVLSVAVELNEQIVKILSRCCITPGAGQEHYSLILVSLCNHEQLSFGLLYIVTRLRIMRRRAVELRICRSACHVGIWEGNSVILKYLHYHSSHLPAAS